MIIYALFCILLAWINRNIIKSGKRVKHFYNGLCHFGAFIWLTLTVNLYTGIAALFMARVVFDVSLNLMRGVGIGYVSPKPKSIVDQIEKKVFGNDGLTPKLVYLFICFVLLNIR